MAFDAGEEGTVGGASPKRCRILDLTEGVGLLDVAKSTLSSIADKVYFDQEYWGGEANTVIIVMDDGTEAWAIGLALETIGLRDESPIATVLIGHKDAKDAVCIYKAEDEIAIGERMPYKADAREAAGTEASAGEPANAVT